MGKRKPTNNFVKNTPKAVTDDDTSEGEEKLLRDLRQGRSGAAFIYPQRRQVWALETPTQQNPAVSSSADATAVVAESFDADDEQESDGPLPSTSYANLETPEPGTSVRILDGTIPIPTYHNAYGYYTNRYQEGENPPYSIERTWQEADPERDIRLVDSDHYPESSPEFMRVGPGYPVNDFRPSNDQCETGRYLRFHGYPDKTPDYIRSGNYYRDHPDPDPNAVTCIHTCEHNCNLANPGADRAEHDEQEPPSFMQMTFKSSDEQADDSLADLNEVLERKAPIDIPLSESQILEQTTQELDVNYDSRENLNYTESGETFEEFEARLVYLLECMKDLSNTNSRFHEFFLSDDVLDENWPRNLSPTKKIEQYEQCFTKIIELDINNYWNFPDPNYFQRMIYRGPDVPRIYRSDRRIQRALSVRPQSPSIAHSSVPELAPDPEEDPEEDNEANEEQVYSELAFSESNDDERSLLIRYAYRAEILSMQLNNVLGRPNFAHPLIHDGDTNTHRGLNARYD